MSSSVISNLDTLFIKLQNSPRFPMICGLSAANFVTSHPWNKTLAEVTLQELTSLPAAELIEMTSATEPQLKDLYESLAPLAEGATPFGTEEPPSISPFELFGQGLASAAAAGTSKTSAIKSKRTFGIAEAEFKLKESAKNLRLSDPSAKLLLQPLETFWPKNAPASPFESSITLRGYLDLNHEALLKKRSMSAEKIDAILSALESAIQASFAEKKGGTSSPFNPDQGRASFVQGSNEQQTFYIPSPSPDSSVYALMLLAAPSLPSLQGFLGACETSESALALWTQGCIETSLAGLPKKTKSEISSWALRTFGPFHTSKDFAAYPTNKILIVSPFGPGLTEQQTIIVSRLVEIALYASGFSHPIVGDTPLTNLWTTEPLALPKLVKACLSLNSKKEGGKLLRQALPFLNEEESQSIISYQGRGAQKKKTRPNRIKRNTKKSRR
jgi:hypothetical protein